MNQKENEKSNVQQEQNSNHHNITVYLTIRLGGGKDTVSRQTQGGNQGGKGGSGEPLGADSELSICLVHYSHKQPGERYWTVALCIIIITLYLITNNCTYYRHTVM